MLVEANGAHLWFDMDGSSLVPDGDGMRQRPVVIFMHGGPASYDHWYFNPMSRN